LAGRDIADGERPAHTLLLAAGIPVVEHLTGLEQLPPAGAWFTAVPLRIQGLGTISVWAFARLPGLPRSHAAATRRNGTLV
jgi:kynurenine formamidase